MSGDGKVIVYAAGAWDMFHVGHLNVLKAAKALGDVLIVGVSTDELVLQYKGHHPLLSYEDRTAVVAACRYVDVVVPQRTLEKDEQLKKLASWVSAELGEHVPVHLSAYFPRYKLNAPPTSPESLEKAEKIFRDKCRYVYLGNVGSPSPTRCRSCGEVLVDRQGYSVKVRGLNEGGKCSACGTDNYFQN